RAGAPGYYLDVWERGCADAEAVGSGIAVTDQIIAIVALGSLNAHAGLTCRDHGSPAHAQKMRNQGLNVVHGALFGGRRGQGMLCFVGPWWHVGETLLQNVQALPHLCHTHESPGIAIPVLGRRYIEGKLLVARVRPLLAEVPGKATGAQVWPGDAPLDGLLQGQAPNPLGARVEEADAQHE